MIGESTYRRMRRSSSSQTPYPLEKRAELDVPALGLDYKRNRVIYLSNEDKFLKELF
jgi:hypothetical protein